MRSSSFPSPLLSVDRLEQRLVDLGARRTLLVGEFLDEIVVVQVHRQGGERQPDFAAAAADHVAAALRQDFDDRAGRRQHRSDQGLEVRAHLRFDGQRAIALIGGRAANAERAQGGYHPHGATPPDSKANLTVAIMASAELRACWREPEAPPRDHSVRPSCRTPTFHIQSRAPVSSTIAWMAPPTAM